MAKMIMDDETTDELDDYSCADDSVADWEGREGLANQYMNTIGQIPLLSTEEEQELIRKMQAGDSAAKEKLIVSNLRLVVSIAKKYAGAMPMEDLVQEGNIGLMHAVEKFDPAQGCRLSTYASCWVRQAILRAIANTGRMIRLPVHASEDIRLIAKKSRKLCNEFGYEPTAAEIAEAAGMNEERVEELLSLSQQPASLDVKVGDDDDVNLGSLLRDPGAVDPEENIAKTQLKEEVKALLTDLPEREQIVISRRFGLDGNRRQTLEEIGKTLGITREYVRQLETRALRRLSSQAHARELEAYLVS